MVLLFCLNIEGIAQRPPPGSFDRSPSRTASTQQQDTSTTKKKNFFTVFSGNPGKAALYSLIIPGAGQLYNGRWWKLPLVYGLEGTAIYLYLQNRNKFNQFNFCYESLIADSTIPPVECEGITTVSDSYRVRNSYRSNKEASFLFVIGAHLLQTLEAFIDRHLIDFDIDEDLSYSPVVPHSEIAQIKLFDWKIPLNKNKLQNEPRFKANDPFATFSKDD